MFFPHGAVLFNENNEIAYKINKYFLFDEKFNLFFQLFSCVTEKVILYSCNSARKMYFLKLVLPWLHTLNQKHFPAVFSIGYIL